MPEPIRIQDFGGMMPRVQERFLPPNAASFANNIDVDRRILRGLHLPTRVEQFATGTTFAYKVPRVGTTPVWITNANELSVVPGPLNEDAHNRFYFTGDGAPKYTTQADIEASVVPIDLGVVTPTDDIIVTPPAGVDDTRAYTYTLVTQYGEESAPSPPIVADGDFQGTWAITAIGTAGGYPTHYDKKHIYRTVAGQVGAGFFYVGEIDVSVTSFNDTILNEEAAFNSLLASEAWAPPPAGLEGLVAMPNGFLAGFSGKDLYFSEPYRPHAWPAEYNLSVPYRIKGLAVIGNSLVVATEGNPSVATGTHPHGMTLTEFKIYEPCVAGRSLVSFGNYALYASHNGIVAVYQNKADIVSRNMFDRDTWEQNYLNNNMQAVRYRQDFYLCHLTGADGFLANFEDPTMAFSEVTFDNAPDILTQDDTSGDVHMTYNAGIYLFNPPNSVRSTLTWVSKEFELARPYNYGAAQVKYLDETDTLADIIAEIAEYNARRIQLSLQPLGGHALGSSRRRDLSATTPITVPAYDPPLVPYFSQNKAPLGGTPLHDIDYLQNRSVGGTLKIYADNVLRETIVLVAPEQIHRLPGGFKATYWKVEYVGNASVTAITIGPTIDSLKKI